MKSKKKIVKMYDVRNFKLTKKRARLLEKWIYQFPCKKFADGFCLAGEVSVEEMFEFIKKQMDAEWEEVK